MSPPSDCEHGNVENGPAAWPWFCRGPQWFRIRGYGVRYINHRRQRPFFSERVGRRRVLHIGPHCFAYLRPSGIGGYR